ncbi:MAG: nitrophenyl compound nitroreductase subunit ArsF family protein [Akkermansiaceae bacterium]|nr:nitrophenyl compound nitroreductase subunit ArsF family protein [Akkermansiaceae bacterium]MCF7732645.1 nitrophenyl compound nitroreductase subunit ArsF family protein [Akkermansiaceae bacterium]
MIAKQIIRGVLLVVALGSLAVWGNREYQKSRAIAAAAATPPPAGTLPVVAGNQVVMTYFISGSRCVSCQKIEELTRETAEKDFPAELAGEKLIFRVVDTGEPANHHYLDSYKLTSKTVVLSHRVDGKETEWSAMEKVWDMLDEPEVFRSYLGTGIRNYLGP